MRKFVFLVLVALLCAGCGGGSSGSSPGVTFYVYDFVENQRYEITADKVAEGSHCYIYLERGLDNDVNVPDAANLQDLVSRFDNYIYPGVRDGFGSEPNPGVDNDPKIHILLTDIRDGYSGGSYIAGYFDPYNEYPNVALSNEKEIFFMDVNPGNPSTSTFRKVLAHEFQHMIHWNLKDNDDTWLDEAMSEIAPYFAGYGANYSRVLTFETGDNRSDSLTIWSDDLADYAVVYMWAQYMADRFPDDVFRSILAYDNTGIDSVEEYLKSLDASTGFASVFRDWSIAVFSGANSSLTGNANWSYQTIDTWAGVRDGYTLPGMLTTGNLNVTTLPSLAPWSIDLYWFDNSAASLAWTSGTAPAPQASFYDWKIGGSLTLDMVSGASYPYDNAAVLVLQNASGSQTSTSGTSAALAASRATVVPPAAKLAAFSASDAGKSLAAATGEPVPVCVHDFLALRVKEMRSRMRESGHAH